MSKSLSLLMALGLVGGLTNSAIAAEDEAAPQPAPQYQDSQDQRSEEGSLMVDDPPVVFVYVYPDNQIAGIEQSETNLSPSGEDRNEISGQGPG